MGKEIVNTSVVTDEPLAALLTDLIEKHEGDMIAVAHELNQTVIKPASERAAAYMLRHHHKALFEALPVGDVDAFDMLNAVNNHLENVSAAINSLDALGGTTVTEQMENLNEESK